MGTREMPLNAPKAKLILSEESQAPRHVIFLCYPVRGLLQNEFKLTKTTLSIHGEFASEHMMKEEVTNFVKQK